MMPHLKRQKEAEQLLEQGREIVITSLCTLRFAELSSDSLAN
jgi:hypothetical protein